MADEPISITVSDNISKGVEQKLLAIATAAEKGDTAVNQLKQSLKGFSALNEIKNASHNVSLLRNEMQQATAATTNLLKATDRLDGEMAGAARSARNLQENLSRVPNHLQNINRGANSTAGALRTLATVFGTAFSIQKLAEASDAYTTIQNKLRGVTSSTQELAYVNENLFDIANEARAGIEGVVDGYQRFSPVLRRLGADTEETLRFTESLTKALATSGKGAQEVSSIVTQLGQALTSGKLSGDEFKSLSENLPIEVMQAFADELGVPIDQLKALSSTGAITAEVIRNAFANTADDIDRRFAQTVPTINSALTVLNNNFIKAMDSSQGPARVLAETILLIADNLDIVIPIVGTFFAIWATASVVTGLTTIATALNTVLTPALLKAAAAALLNPVFLIGAAATAAVGGIAYYTGALDGLIAKINEVTGANIPLKNAIEQTTASGVTGAQQQGAANEVVRQGVVNATGAYVKLGETAAEVNERSLDGWESVRLATEQYNLVVGTASENIENLAGTGGNSFETITDATKTTTGATEELNSTLEGTGESFLEIGNAAEDSLGTAKSAIDKMIDWLGDLWEMAVKAARAVGDAISGGGNSSPSSSNPRSPNLGRPSPGPNGPNDPFLGSRSSYGLEQFAGGGSFTVGGRGGTDNNLVKFSASRGERVDILTPAQQRNQRMAGFSAGGRPNVNLAVNIINPRDGDTWRRSKGQIAAEARAALLGAF